MERRPLKYPENRSVNASTTGFCSTRKEIDLVPTQLLNVLFPLIPLFPYLLIAPSGLFEHLQKPRMFNDQIRIGLVGLRSRQLVVFPKTLVLFRFFVKNSDRLQFSVRRVV